uniref:Bm12309 n=1 Tax=Brugia malayi TaxID=6279 RepID=A0A1I9GB67_BRUMA|nr:Bm12309 [Brugia malayi]
MVDPIDGFPYIEPILHTWDEAYLVIVDDIFDVFLDSVYLVDLPGPGSALVSQIDQENCPFHLDFQILWHIDF